MLGRVAFFVGYVVTAGGLVLILALFGEASNWVPAALFAAYIYLVPVVAWLESPDPFERD
jgi:hypothetical protein